MRDIPLKDIDINQASPARRLTSKACRSGPEHTGSRLLQPILVTEHRNRYRIVAGTALRAARLAGLTAVPCIVREFTANEQWKPRWWKTCSART